jgi:uncharacterized protein YkwD
MAHSDRLLPARGSASTAAFISAFLLLAGCASGAASQRGGAAVAGGKFSPSAPPAAQYGADPTRKCEASQVRSYVARDLQEKARLAQKPVPELEGRMCSIAESMLAWDESQPPPDNVVSFISWYFGLPQPVVRPIIATIDVENPADLAPRIEEVLIQYMTTASQVRYGLATARGARGGTKLSLVVQEPLVEIEPLPRKLDPKGEATLSGRLLDPLDNATVLISDPRGKLQQPESKGKQFRVPLSCGGRTGRMVVEIRGEDQGATRLAASFLVTCGIDQPTSAEVPPAQPGDVGQQERAVFDRINAERTEAGLPALTWDAKVAQVARAVSESEAKGAKGGAAAASTAELTKRLQEAGLSTSIVLQNPGEGRTPQSAHERFSMSPFHRTNYMSTDVTHGGVGVAWGADSQAGKLAVVTELFVRELAAVDVGSLRTKLRQAIDQKRRAAGMATFATDAVLERIAGEYAKELAGSKGNISNVRHSQLVSPLYKNYRTVDLVSGVKGDPLEFAEEKTVTASKEKAMGIGIAQGDHPVLGKNAVYVVLLFATKK